MRETVCLEADIIFGNVIDDTLGSEIRMTVITAGSGEATGSALLCPNVVRMSVPVAQQRPAAPEAKAPATETTRIT